MLRVPAPAIAALLVLAACADPHQDAAAPAPGPVGKGPVTRDDLLGAHRCRATGTSGASCLWEFRDAEFSIARDGKPIPPKVLVAVTGRADDAARVDGKWALDGGALLLTALRTATDDGRTAPAPDVKLAPFRTPVVRFEFGATQYVLDGAR